MYETLLWHEKMRRSHLIQRLKKPIGGDNSWSFGGGLKNGGISQKGMDLIRDIFSFDYMGSAEFEFGAVPAALDFLAEQSSLKAITSGKIQGVYFICPKSYVEGVTETILALLDDESNMRLKERCGLKDRIKNPSKYNESNVGWLELDNGFFFFLDKDMFKKTKLLFEVP